MQYPGAHRRAAAHTHVVGAHIALASGGLIGNLRLPRLLRLLAAVIGIDLDPAVIDGAIAAVSSGNVLRIDKAFAPVDHAFRPVTGDAGNGKLSAPVVGIDDGIAA